MERQKFLSFILFMSCFVVIDSNEPCFLRYKSADTPIFAPFILTMNKTLYPVKDNAIKIHHETNVVVTCENNYIKSLGNVNSVTVTCRNDALKNPKDNSDIKFKQLGCDLKIIEDFRYHVEKCDNKYQGIIYAYYDTFKQAYVKLADVCYDYKKNRNVFVRTYVSDVFPADEMLLNDKNLVSNSNMKHYIDVLYGHRADRIRYKLIQKMGDDFNEYIHMTASVGVLPKNIFNGQLEDVEKFSTNKVALWMMVAEGNWKRVLNDVQDLLKEREGTLELIFGTDQDGDLYLGEDGNTMPIPKYMWIVLHDRKTHKGIAIMTLNNPSAEQLTEPMLPGENMCKKVPWLRSLLKNNNFDRYIYGLTFCSELSRFQAYSVDNKSHYTKDSILLN